LAGQSEKIQRIERGAGPKVQQDIFGLRKYAGFKNKEGAFFFLAGK
jgi:hypothetical protein